MDNSNIPHPDLTGWENDLSNLNTNIQTRVDDETIKDFYNNNKDVEYDANQLLHILKTKTPPLTDDELTTLKSFIKTSPVLGYNHNTNSFGECVRTVANSTLQWHDAIVKSIKYLERYSVNPLTSKKNHNKMVSQVRKTIGKVYKRFPYSPHNCFMDTGPRGFMYTLFASKISALFMNEARVVRYTLLHRLAQIFTGSISYPGANHEEKLPLFPRNYIHYKLALVMCGTMIDYFIQEGYLKWSSIIDSNELIISKSHSGTNFMFESTLTPNTVINQTPPASKANANRTKRERKPPSVVGAGDVGITDKSKSDGDGDSITEIFDRIDTALKCLKAHVSINFEDPVQSELPSNRKRKHGFT
jgi:hypothetical protein